MKLARYLVVSAAALGLGVASSAESHPAPQGWSANTDGPVRTVSKGTSQVRVGPWESLNGASVETWLDARRSWVPGGVEFVSAKDVKAEGKIAGAFYVTQKTRIGGKTANSTVLACPGEAGAVRLLRLDVVGTNFGDMMTGGTFLENVCVNEPKGVAGETVSKPAPPESAARDQTGAAASEPVPPSSSVVVSGEQAGALSAAPKLPGLKDVRGVIVFGVQPSGMFGLTEDYIALFQDGTFTKDVAGAFGKGKAASKRDKPGYWGRWRVRGGELELKEDDKTSFDDTRGNWIARAGSSDERLDGCYGSLSSSSGADYSSGTTVGLARTWCFYPDGRFTNSATAFGRDGSAAMRVSDKARGRYRIDGYMARFVYDDGHEVVSVFSYATEERNHVMLNGKRFMGAK